MGVFIVMLGPKPKTAHGVVKQVAAASGLSKSRFQLIGYPDGGRTFSWNWENLRKLLSCRA
jgi:hypothetical protein